MSAAARRRGHPRRVRQNGHVRQMFNVPAEINELLNLVRNNRLGEGCKFYGEFSVAHGTLDAADRMLDESLHMTAIRGGDDDPRLILVNCPIYDGNHLTTKRDYIWLSHGFVAELAHTRCTVDQRYGGGVINAELPL